MDRKVIDLQIGRTIGAMFFCSLGFATYDICQRLVALGVWFSLRTFWWPVAICFSVISFTGILFIWTPYFKKIVTWFSKYYRPIWSMNKMVSWGIFIILSLGFSTGIMFMRHIVLSGTSVRIFIYIVIAILGSIVLRPLKTVDNWQVALVCSLLITAAFYRAMTYLPGLSSSPFSLTWSEGSRYYYGSLYFSKRMYGQDLPLSLLHPSRYMLLSLPFLIPGLSIWVHRLWQVFLWIGLGWWAAVLLSKRLKIKNSILFISFSAWIYLFLNLGPVYYHLFLCVILLYWGVDFNKPFKTLMIVVTASVWAGLSRINWIPVPFFLVVTLYFLECRWSITKANWRYLLQPVIWGIGLFFAFFAYRGYIQLSGNGVNKFSSSFSSDLIWNRLWPNSTFPLGILPGILLVSIPLWVLLYVRLKNTYTFLHPIKRLGYSGMIVLLLLGGLVVSVKIGGGSNLHNMDAYFVLLTTLASYIFWRRGVYDGKPSKNFENEPLQGWVTALLLIIPIFLTLRTGGMINFSDQPRDQNSLETLNRIVSEAAESGGEVLFITERQLQVFNLISDIPLVHDYEKLELMEMAMASNEEYLENFYQDIQRQRFALIVNDSFHFGHKDESKAFFEEDEIWDEKIMRTLVKYYQYDPLSGHSNIFIMTPKKK